MSWKSVKDILATLEVQAKLPEQPLARLLPCWPEIVGVAIAAHTRPLFIKRNVLYVATSSAAWAQNLTFERQQLLAKLNAILPAPLSDIRFSTASWYSTPKIDNQQQQPSICEHPSYAGQDKTSTPGHRPSSFPNVRTAFANWAKSVQQRSHRFPLCPLCHCRAPAGELQRWGMCYLCAAKQFSQRF
jgi:predicted nucleic acid-binding Zn ribbon protein